MALRRRRGFGMVDCGNGLSVADGTACPDTSSMGPPSVAQVAAYNALVCPAGYHLYAPNSAMTISTKMSDITVPNMCADQWGLPVGHVQTDPQIAALQSSYNSQKTQSYALMAGGGALVLMGDSTFMKLAGAALIFFGWGRGAFIGGL